MLPLLRFYGLKGFVNLFGRTPELESAKEMKLDPEEQVIAEAMEQADVEDANRRGASARIEFRPEGYAKVTITISRELVERARALDLTTLDLFVEALRFAVPRAFGIPRALPPRLH